MEEGESAGADVWWVRGVQNGATFGIRAADTSPFLSRTVIQNLK